MSGVLTARVKSVLSGDTLVLTAPNNPKSERTLSLAFVSAPRLRREGDEPHAFESREFLRTLVVGKLIQFRVLYDVPMPSGGKREYGTCFLQDGQRLPEAAASEGWLKLRDDASRKAEDLSSNPLAKEALDRIQVEQAKASQAKKGLWSADAAPKLVTEYDVDAAAFVEKYKGRELDAIVERVLTGDRVLLRFLLEPGRHVQAMSVLAGIRTPSTRRVNQSDGKAQPAEPFGEEAVQFAEARILQRVLKAKVVGVSPQGQLIVDASHPQHGSVAEHLLRSGLARCVDHHSTMLGAQMSKLRIAESNAKSKKLNIFQGHVAKAAGSNVEVTVSRIQTADTVSVRSRQGAEKSISLSSVRQPKPKDPKQGPFQAEAREFLRKKLIGKHVKVSVDGKRPASEGFEEREVATVTVGNANVALMLVEAGYASVIRHRRDDTDRSPIYDELLAAEEAATTAKKGMWGDKAPAAKQYVDYSESLQRAKVQASVLQRQKRIPAIVDFVKGGSRFTVLIPRENAKLTLVLSCIRAPRSARNEKETSEPFGQEALDFANRRCLQRDVEVDIEGTDKVGGFIGSLYVARENYGKALLEEGLATVHAYSAEQHPDGAELFQAEKKAKGERKGMWHDYDPSQDEQEEANGGSAATNGDAPESAAAAATRKTDPQTIIVTYVDSESLKLKIQIVGSGTGALEELTTKFRSFHSSSANSKPAQSPPRVGQFVSARFTADGQWYRARIASNDREAKASTVRYIDYGNSEKLPWSSLRALPDQFNASVLKAQAGDAVLSLLALPSKNDYLADAVDFLYETLADRRLAANVDSTDSGGVMSLTVWGEGKGKTLAGSINAEVLAEGLAMLPKTLRGWEKSVEQGEIKALREVEEKAKSDRRGMWEYGDITED